MITISPPGQPPGLNCTSLLQALRGLVVKFVGKKCIRAVGRHAVNEVRTQVSVAVPMWAPIVNYFIKAWASDLREIKYLL